MKVDPKESGVREREEGGRRVVEREGRRGGVYGVREGWGVGRDIGCRRR